MAAKIKNWGQLKVGDKVFVHFNSVMKKWTLDVLAVTEKPINHVEIELEGGVHLLVHKTGISIYQNNAAYFPSEAAFNDLFGF